MHVMTSKDFISNANAATRKDYGIAQLVPYINWTYFYHAWGLSGKPLEARQSLRAEAERMLASLDGRYMTHAVWRVAEANTDGDDIVIAKKYRMPMLRQQHADDGTPNLCLADFIRPLRPGGEADRIGVFATTVDHGLEHDFRDDDFRRMMAQTLADRLAEATSEVAHLEIRTRHWGYANDERLGIEQLLREEFQGIRPAVGYPSMPDTSLNFIIDDIIDMKSIGISLTESGAMRPHASVSGLMMAHPQARYFDIGKIGEDQLRDYAARRGVPVTLMRRFLANRVAGECSHS